MERVKVTLLNLTETALTINSDKKPY